MNFYMWQDYDGYCVAAARLKEGYSDLLHSRTGVELLCSEISVDCAPSAVLRPPAS